jgi:hypothetical protein
MPSFEVNFEVFCGTCGAGLCNQSDSRKSRNRYADQVSVEACQCCIEKAIEPLQDEIKTLKEQLKEEKEQNEFLIHQQSNFPQ